MVSEVFDLAKLDAREEEGAGLGLAIAKRILDRHNSTLSVRTVPGEGTSFVFTLRIAEAAAEPPPASGVRD